jgi:endonuclease/exonuclease/phosphatase family metal-dependent hydrolase
LRRRPDRELIGQDSGDTHTVSFDPYAPYGPLVESTARFVTWNVWGRYGADRQAGIEQALLDAAPDVVCLVESWRTEETTQPELVAARLGMAHHHFVGDWEQEDWVSGVGLVSRWPMNEPVRRPLRDENGSGFGAAVHVVVEGERGPIQLFVVALDYPLDASVLRQAQVRELGRFVSEVSRRRYPTVVCGDFNAGPDSDEIRMLTGASATAILGLVFYDAWEVAGDGTPGYTWSNRNPLAALGLYPDRRFDYILSAWPRLGGAGHPVGCALLGVRPPGDPQLSDHYGVVADLRY